MQHHPVVSREEWLSARKALLAKEKEATHLRDRVNAERLALPWVKVETDYVFDTPAGKKTLAELFDGRSQLIVYHFMLGPGWAAGCTGCSFLADHFDGALTHLEHHDVTMIAVSRAPLAEIEAYRTRMGWRFPWVSSFGSDFNFDYHVSFTKDELASGKVFYNFSEIDAKAPRKRRAAGPQRLLQGRGRHRVPQLFELCARRRGIDRHPDDPRSGAERPQREEHHEFRAPP